MNADIDDRYSTSIPQSAPGQDIHRAALTIAGQGKPVFPCRPDKKPYTKHGHKDATVDPAKVNMYWNSHRGAHIGMPTGWRSDLFVMDVDRLEALEELPHELPETLTIRTPSGGLHSYFNHVEGLTNSPGALPDGIDIRGEGGYVIIAPSPGYTVEHHAPVADAPDWLLEALRDKPTRPGGPGEGRPCTTLPDEGGLIPEGSRNVTLTSIAGSLRARGHDEGEIRDALLEINDSKCELPLPESEVRRIAQSIARYPVGNATSRPDAETLSALDEFVEEIDAATWRGMGGKSERSALIALVKMARHHGGLIPCGGVRVSCGVRTLALAAATSKASLTRAGGTIDRLKRNGWIRRDNSERTGTEAGAFVLMRANLTHSTTEPKNYGESGLTLRAPLSAPRLRWSAPQWERWGDELVRSTINRLGKSAEHIVDVLERAGGTLALSSLAEELHVKRSRDLRRRVISRLETASVVVVEGETVSLTPEWLEALNRKRESGGEIEAYRRDMARYAREREAYATRHQRKPDRAPSQSEMDAEREEREQSVPAEPAQAERRRSWGGPTDDEELDIKAAAREVDQLVRQGMKRSFAIEEVCRLSA